MKLRALALLCALTLLDSQSAAPVLGASQTAEPFHFPRDYGAHLGYQDEVWDFYGNVSSADGRRFGYQFTVFRFGIKSDDALPAAGSSRWHRAQLYAANFAITNIERNRFVFAERFARGVLGMGSAAPATLDVRVQKWFARLTGGSALASQRITLAASDRDNALDVELVPQKLPLPAGTDGSLQLGACATCAERAYVVSRLSTRGTLTVDGTKFSITGSSWLTHSFGSRLTAAGQEGWDQLSLQLADGRDVLFFIPREKVVIPSPFALETERGANGQIYTRYTPVEVTEPKSTDPSALLVRADGSSQTLGASDFAITRRGDIRWTSTRTGARYPSLWEISVPSEHLDIAVTPAQTNQEIVAQNGGQSYYEGSVVVDDLTIRGHNPRIGYGYVQLTGYAESVSM